VNSAVLREVRAAAKRGPNTAKWRAIAAACTSLLRHKFEEHPEGRYDDASGRWHPSGRDADVFDPATLQRSDRGSELKSQRPWRSIDHCAALHDANPATTRRYVRLFLSDRPHDKVAVLKLMPLETAAKVLSAALAKD
jgi:hypothetical protein